MLIDDVLRLFAENLADYLYAYDDVTIEEQIIRLLKLRGKKISVAESFTGGGLAQKLTSVSGASEVYFEGINAYHEGSKMMRLQVSDRTLIQQGAVSQETAYEMATGLLATGCCDICIATTGLAGDYLKALSAAGLTADATRFVSRDALDNYVRAQLAQYKNHPAFYGVMLADEPSYHNAYCYSEIYKSIKRVMPDCYVQYNLLPMESDAAAIERYYTGVANNRATSAQIEAAYTQYVTLFVDAMGTDYIQYDDYPFKSATDGMWFWETTTPYIDTTSLRNIQLVAELAKERGLSVKVVTQSCVMKKGGSNGDVLIRQITEEDARWLNNYLMGFGVKQINYFT